METQGSPLNVGSFRGVDAAIWITIQQLVTEHSYLVDHGRADELASLYTPDGELLGLPPKDLLGREHIAEWGRNRVMMTNRTARHVESNLRLSWDHDTLRGTLSVMMFRSDTADLSGTSPQMVGEYQDEYSFGAEGWLIRRRSIQRVFFSPGLAAQPDGRKAQCQK